MYVNYNPGSNIGYVLFNLLKYFLLLIQNFVSFTEKKMKIFPIKVYLLNMISKLKKNYFFFDKICVYIQ